MKAAPAFVLLALAPWLLLVAPAPKAGKDPDQIARIDAMARLIDLDAGEGRLEELSLLNPDPRALLQERHLWRDAAGLARKCRLEYDSGEDTVFADYYYDAQGALRLLAHFRASSKAVKDQADAAPVEETFQQRIYMDARGKILRVAFRRTSFSDASTPEREEEGELAAPDESYWPLRYIRDPWAEFKEAQKAMKGEARRHSAADIGGLP